MRKNITSLQLKKNIAPFYISRIKNLKRCHCLKKDNSEKKALF